MCRIVNNWVMCQIVNNWDMCRAVNNCAMCRIVNYWAMCRIVPNWAICLIVNTWAMCRIVNNWAMCRAVNNYTEYGVSSSGSARSLKISNAGPVHNWMGDRAVYTRKCVQRCRVVELREPRKSDGFSD